MSATPKLQEPAQLRLDQSRARLRLALHRVHAKADPAGHGPTLQAHTGWLDALRAEPAAGVLLDALALWWARQPWQQSATLLSGVVAQRLRPLAERNPLGLVLGAAALGGLVIVLKPWRWISVPALAAGLLPPLVSKVIAQLRPLSWTELLASWLQATDRPDTPP